MVSSTLTIVLVLRAAEGLEVSTPNPTMKESTAGETGAGTGVTWRDSVL